MPELGVLLKPTGHSNAKAFVKPVMHCRAIDVTPESLSHSERKRLYDSRRENEPPPIYPSSRRDARIDLRACARVLCGILQCSVGRTFGQKPFLENDDDWTFAWWSGVSGTRLSKTRSTDPCSRDRRSYPLVVFPWAVLLRSEGIKTDGKIIYNYILCFLNLRRVGNLLLAINIRDNL